MIFSWLQNLFPRRQRSGAIARKRKLKSAALVAERLEARTLLTPFYDLTVVASTGGAFEAFGNLVSINNDVASTADTSKIPTGTIAFVGMTDADNDGTRESGLWTFNARLELTNINPEYSNTNGRDFGRAVDINDDGVLVARDRYDTEQNQFYVRAWSSNSVDVHVNIASAGGVGENQPDFGKYSILQTFTDINDNSDIVFVAQVADGSHRELVLKRHNISEPLSFFEFESNTIPRPQLTGSGQVLYRASKTELMLFDPISKAHVNVAGGFTNIGYASGISEDGRLISFIGDKGDGLGVYLAYRTGVDVFKTVRVAGAGQDGWSLFDPTSAVRVNNTLQYERGVTVAFEGTHNTLGTGLYTTRVSFIGDDPTDWTPDYVAPPYVHGAVPVVRLGDTVGGQSVTDISFWNGLNDRNRGELAFWVETTGGERIVRAEPWQVAAIDFSPSQSSLETVSLENSNLLKLFGITDNVGWESDFVGAVQAAGLSSLATAGAQTDIVNRIQSYFQQADARVRVVGRPGDPALEYVPYTELTSIPLQQVIRGVAQTIYVGGKSGPAGDGRSYYGLASDTYEGMGVLDFFNQVNDDSAVILADHIFQDGALFSDPQSTPYTNLVQAISAIIAHEIGHNFGVYHLEDGTSSTLGQIMRTTIPTDTDLTHSEVFSNAVFPRESYLDRNRDEITPGNENSVARLRWGAGYIKNTLPLPKPADDEVLEVGENVAARANLPYTPTGQGPTVARMLLGTIQSGYGEFLPEFEDLGHGSIAQVLAAAKLAAGPGTQFILLGSTDGTRLDIVGLPNGSTFDLADLDPTLLGISTTTGLQLAFDPDASTNDFQLFHLPQSGAPVLMGTAAVENVAEITLSINGATIDRGAVYGLGETTPGGGALTRVVTIRNSGSGTLNLGTVSIAGSGYSVTQPGQASLLPGQETTVTVTLSDANAGIGLEGQLTIPSNDPAGAFQFTLRGTVDNRPRVLGVTRIDNGTGPVQIAIDFSGPLLAGPAGNADNFTIARDNGESIAVASAVYSQNGATSRVTLTLSVAGNELQSSDYRVRIDGTQVLTATSAPLATTRENLLSHQIWDNVSLVTIGSDGSGEPVVLSGPESTGVAPPSFIVVGDFNGDGAQDYVATSEHSGQLVFHWGDEDEGYITEVLTLDRPHPEVKAAPRTILSADWNNDGLLDLVVHDAASDFFQGNLNRLLVYLNSGSGTFVLALDTPILLPSDVEGPLLAVGDYTGDGLPDIAIAGPRIGFTGRPYSAAGSVAIYGKDPFLGYSQVALLSTEHQEWFPYAASSSDVNGDGWLDLVVATTGYFVYEPRPVVYLSTPTGLVLSEDLVYEGEGGPVTVGDFTGDGKADIAIVNDYYSNAGEVSDGGVVSLLVGNGAGQFTARPNIVLGRRGVELVATGDVNQDGELDLVLSVTSYSPENAIEISIWVLHGDGSGDFDLTGPQLAIAPTGNFAPGNFVLQDITGDGYPELSFGNTITGQIGLFVNDGTGRLSPSRSGPLTTSATAFSNGAAPEKGSIIVDINRDGFLDQLRIVSGYYRGGPVADAIDVFWGNAEGQFQIVASLNIPFLQPESGLSFRDIGSLRVGDLNNDGWGDLVVSSDSGSLQIYLGVDGRDFVPAPEFLISASAGVNVVSGELVDVNADGNLDYLATVSGSRGVPTGFAVFFGNGTGKLTYNLTSFLPIEGLKSPFAGNIGQTPVIADLNGDQKLDLAIGVDPQNGQADANRLLVYYGVGNGRFNLGQSLVRDPVDNAGQVHLRDVNGDGLPDLLSAGNSNDADDSITFYLGTVGGQFVAAPELTRLVGHQIGSLVFGDFTGDGHDDIALTRYTRQIGDFVTTVSIFAGDGSGAFAAPDLVDTGALWPHSLVVIPIAGTIEAGSFAVSQPVLSVPAGAANIATSTLFNKPVAIDPRPLFVPYTNDPFVLAVSIAPTHGTVAVQNNATPADITDDTFVYTPMAGFSGADTFSYLAADGRGGIVTGTVTIAVSPPNQAPAVTPSAGSLTYTGPYQYRLIDPAVLVSDPDSPNFQGGKLTVAITLGFDSGFDYLSIESTGTGPGQVGGEIGTSNLTYSGVVIGQLSGGYQSPIVITFNAAATPAAVQAVLRRFSFANFEGERLVSSQRTVTFTLTDGDGGTTNATKTILLPAEGSNLGPVITLSTGSPVYTAGTAAIVIDAAATVTDADSANFAGGSLTIDFADFTEATDRLAIRSVGTGVGQINRNGNAVRYGTTVIGTYSGGFVNNSALVITLGSAATPTTVQALLRQITFSNGDPTATALPRTIRFVADDGLGGIGDAAYRSVTIAEIALVPVITLSSGPTEFPGGQTAVVIDDAASVVDEDSADFAGGSLTVSFASGHSTADRLGIFDHGTGFDEINLVGNSVRWGVTEIGTYSGGFTSNSALVITLNSYADPQTVGTLIRHITFNVASDTPGTSDRIIHFVLNDGDGGTSQAAAKTIVVGSGANPAPIVQLSSGSPTFSKLGPAVAVDNQLTVTSPNLGGGVLTISINDVNTGKKKFDVFSTSSLSGIGTSRGTQLVAGRWIMVIDLDSNATAQMVQNALRAVTFKTSARGMKFTTRNVKIQLEDVDGDESQVVTKTINVSKKRINPPRS